MKFQIIADKIIKKSILSLIMITLFLRKLAISFLSYLLSVDLVANSGIAEEDKNH